MMKKSLFLIILSCFLNSLTYAGSVFFTGPHSHHKDRAERARISEAIQKLGLIPVPSAHVEDFESVEGFADYNLSAIDAADYVLLDATPVLGLPSMGVNEAFIAGYSHAKGKPVLAYSKDQRLFKDRVAEWLKRENINYVLEESGEMYTLDENGERDHTIENFNLADNLMLPGAVKDQFPSRSGSSFYPSYEEALAVVVGKEIQAPSFSNSYPGKYKYSFYVAGPDVFFKDPMASAERAKKDASSFGFEAVFPLDTEIEDFAFNAETGIRIYIANRDIMLLQTNAINPNLQSWHGPFMDVGTAWEVGFMKGMGLPILGFSKDTESLETRAIKYLEEMGISYQRNAQGFIETEGGLLIEKFGTNNISMISASSQREKTKAATFYEAIEKAKNYCSFYL